MVSQPKKYVQDKQFIKSTQNLYNAIRNKFVEKQLL